MEPEPSSAPQRRHDGLGRGVAAVSATLGGVLTTQTHYRRGGDADFGPAARTRQRPTPSRHAATGGVGSSRALRGLATGPRLRPPLGHQADDAGVSVGRKAALASMTTQMEPTDDNAS